jgi:hypothetical protein
VIQICRRQPCRELFRIHATVQCFLVDAEIDLPVIKAILSVLQAEGPLKRAQMPFVNNMSVALLLFRPEDEPPKARSEG